MHFNATTDVTTSVLSTQTWRTTFSQIPNYDRVFSSNDIQELNSRPKASTDFKNKSTTADAGTTYKFGDDIGYLSNSCSLGYWPPGPVCPAAVNLTVHWNLNPAPETRSDGCFVPIHGPVGRWV